MGGTVMETESEKLIREGMKQGLSQGLNQGMNQGQARILTLNNILLSQNRVEDLRRASEDAEYRKQLLEEYSIL